jgi:predicted Zn-dependent peptidase
MNRSRTISAPLLSGLLLGLVAGCGGESPPPVTPPLTVATASASPAAAAPADPLGPRPDVPTPPPFAPPVPQVFTGTSGITVWLLERHDVPLVACNIDLPSGAASDPKGKAGLAYATANMLDEGAGKRGALDFARAVDDLGAHLGTSANADSSFVSLSVLKRNLDKAFALFGDAVARPRLEAAEWKRVSDLWTNELKERDKDPNATARVVYRVALFGPDHPYGHPWDGTLQSARAVTLDDVRNFYKTAYRPDRATLVCVGDLTKAELTPLMDSAFGSWKAPATPPPALVTPAAPAGPWPRLILVDRPDAPQAVIATVKPGLAASSPDAPPLWRVNNVIGGSFTSRLNQDLREAKGYTYGVSSRYSESRGPGMVITGAAVRTDATGDALGAMLADLKTFADAGLTDDETAKSRSQARGELVSTYESFEHIAGQLAGNASLGLPPDWEVQSSQRLEAATKDDLDRLAKQYFAPDGAILVVVGPRARVQTQLDKLGLPAPEIRDATGNILK